jgi:hypothetical protein
MNQRDRRGEMELKTWGQRKSVNDISSSTVLHRSREKKREIERKRARNI